MNKNTIPTTARRAFRILDAMLTPKDAARFRGMSPSEFSCDQHFDLGMWIRNNWIYGPGEEDEKERELRDECYRMLAGVTRKDYLFEHPDTVTSRFLERYHRHLKRKLTMGKNYKAREDEVDQNLSERGKGYIFGPDTDANSAKVWWISHGYYNQRLLVMDASRAWLLEMPHGEKNLDNYIACITAYTKDFMALYGGQTHKELALNMHHVHWNDRTIDPFIEKVKGKKEFKVLDFRVTDKSSDLDKYIKEKAAHRRHISQECFMYWYKGVARELMARGMTEDETLELLKRHPVDVLLIKKHCGGLTPDVLATRLLTKE